MSILSVARDDGGAGAPGARPGEGRRSRERHPTESMTRRSATGARFTWCVRVRVDGSRSTADTSTVHGPRARIRVTSALFLEMNAVNPECGMTRKTHAMLRKEIDKHGRPVEQLGSLGSTYTDKATTVLNPDLASLLSVLEVFRITLTRALRRSRTCSWSRPGGS